MVLSGVGVLGENMLFLGDGKGWGHVEMEAALISGCVLRKLLISLFMCISSSLTYKLCAGEYPFHLTRYCFFFY
jgi:hypothetical protein